MGREDPQLKVRLSEELKSKITDAARQNGRSVNAEIVARLAQTFDGEEELWKAFGSLEETVEQIRRRLEKIEPHVGTMWSKFEGGNFGSEG